MSLQAFVSFGLVIALGTIRLIAHQFNSLGMFGVDCSTAGHVFISIRLGDFFYLSLSDCDVFYER
jgi:hypothetical protein|tara:strand:- start:66663 stop:66857 length:195 start_codon:yes stop_codon:yes gene_type:complete